ncbi:DUF2069 domain-containing protein [Ramlibacter ginsenosidimutans]|uniref:DUF2069 domain-containing protein n=1 Tax=Ramlibacter ginsenosidimutans TaxID=502333 RepID=A0A934WPX7_9BURK|nr:DUF2069 domain-containing protein [Ramlibacter ginsenosidimutans]MBK6008567.1 DUF2069 domain-containing protein [Ramlibacter ginsenosidimutans]
MQSPEVAVPPAVEATRWIAFASLLGLIVLSLAWELWLPARPSLWVVKVLPLCIPVTGLLKRRMYTYRWVSLLVWPYFLEGVVRANEGWPAALEIALSLILFAACGMHVRLRLRSVKS